ncbi:MAG TPA: hypothetical protein PLD25_30930 [Chloroflexota bacterium]|nr:hypothetical protein [Chloroflexota bacterium]HUM67594.1 hypothetical protein [Chloroflexota bacterium]
MRELIQKWYDWLKQACPEPAEVATSTEKEELSHVYSDGRQLWATDGYRLHARQVATGKPGHVVLDENGLFQVNGNGRLPNFAVCLPQSQPTATLVIERDKLLGALAGQDRHVRLTFFVEDGVIELSSAGAYALVMAVVGLEEEDFWRPDTSEP